MKKWEEEQMGIANVRFGARDAKERNKVCNIILHIMCMYDCVSEIAVVFSM